jgi:endogenous inhibitor of DNA gyrase (YacG/DUF329 family)
MPQIKKDIRTINGVKKLKCSKCNYWLPFDEFRNAKNTSTGKRSYCKVCQKSHYDSKRTTPSNSGIKGIYLHQCEYCKSNFTSKNPIKVFCSHKCRKRDWYEKNEQTATAKKHDRSKSHLNFKKNKEAA